jgi:hypothetical protein
MMPSMLSLVLFAHIAAATVLVGGHVFTPVLHRLRRSARTRGELLTALDLDRRAHVAHPAASLVLLATGIEMGRAGWYEFPWFWVAFALWLCNAGLAKGVLQRSGQALAALLLDGDGDAIPPDATARRDAVGPVVAERVMVANNLVLLWMMIDKPTLPQCLGLVAAANALIVGLPLLRDRVASARGERTEKLRTASI